MHNLQVEHRPLNHGGLAFDLANHLYTRLALGNAAVVTDRPEELMGETKRQVAKIMHRLQAQRSKTDDASRLIELSNAISKLQCWRFSASEDDFLATVQYGTPAVFLASPPAPQILYITCPIPTDQVNMITAWMKAGDLVVIYG